MAAATATHEPPTAALDDAPAPRLAPGVELIGRFEDSGFKEAPFIARRADGQVVQMPGLLYALAEEVGDGRPVDAIARRLSDRIKRGVSTDAVEMLIDERLRPLGVVAPPDGATQPELKKVDPLLALRLRTKVVPQRAVAAITSLFRPLFLTPVVAVAVTAFAALDVWLFAVHGISQSLRHVLYQPALLLMLLGGVVLATAFHEVGHATACRFGGAKPGVMGVGIYIVWPAFYTDITDAYRLGKVGRLRTDLGGMYFNALFALAAGAAYFATGFEPLLLLIVLQTFTVIQQSLPFLRLDGYYILSDLTGVPDMLSRIKPVLVSLVPGRRADDRVRELKPWVRGVVTAYVMALVPVLAFMFLMMLINAPRVFATGYDSLLVHWDRIGPDFSAGQGAVGAMDALQMVALVLPALGMVYTTSRVGHRAGTASWRWSAGDPLRRGVVVAAAAALAGSAAFLWWPHGEYRPIQPGERGTIFGGVKSLSQIPTGRPSLTPQRQAELGGAPALHAQQRSRPGTGQLRPPTDSRAGRAPLTRRESARQSPDGFWQRLEWPAYGTQGGATTTGGATGDSPDPGGQTQPGSTAAPAQPAPESSTQPTPSSAGTTSTAPTQTTPSSTDTTSTTPTDTTPSSTDTTSTTPTDTTPTTTTP